MMENTKWRKFGNGNSVVDANHSYLTAHGHHHLVSGKWSSSCSWMLITNDQHSPDKSAIPGSSRYVKFLPFGWVFLMKRHKYYNTHLEDPGYSYRWSSHMVFRGCHFHGNFPIWNVNPLTKMPSSKWGQKHPGRKNGCFTWEYGGGGPRGNPDFSSSKAHHFQVLHLISLCWEPLFILCTSLRLIPKKNHTMYISHERKNTGRLLKFHEILAVFFGGILISL